MSVFRISFLSCCLILVPITGSAQRLSKVEEQVQRRWAVQGTQSILDRAGGNHNVGNIGLFFENRGKLYPHEEIQGPSGEFPIHSKHEYIYRINSMVGVPGNVIQARYTQDEEWEAAAGYNNPDSARIAFSDIPYSWPRTGWPVKDASGNSVFVSDQDSYCVYNDSMNSKGILGIEVAQIGYDFSPKSLQDFIFFTYRVTNKSQRTYDGLYFGLYIDIDVGNATGGALEYSDDKLGYDKATHLLYFYDSKGYSLDWKAPTGYFGVVMLRTPKVNDVELGVTDLHYNIYDDDYDIDSVQYGILSGSSSISKDPFWGPKYFHLGSNAPNPHFDDPATIPATGLDLVANMGSGPYTIHPGDTLTFMTLIVAGNTYQEIVANTKQAYDVLAADFRTPRAPDAPKVSVISGDRRAAITWGNRSELSRDPLSGKLDFEGYRVYKSIDEGQHWDQLDRNVQPTLGPDPVPLADFDKIDGVGNDVGLQYVYIDSNLTNGFKYWYSVTAYDQGDSSTASLECARGNSTDAPNFGLAIPRSAAIGRTPVSALPVTQTGAGTSNVSVIVQPMDVATAGGKNYEVGFAPILTIGNGNLTTLMQLSVDSSTANSWHTYTLTFRTPSTFRLRDITTGRVLLNAGLYTSGNPILIAGLRLLLTDTASSASLRPEAGDSLVIRQGMRVVCNGVEVLPLQPFSSGIWYATSDGVTLSVQLVNPIRSVTQTSGTRPLTVEPTVTSADSVKDQLYRLSVVRVFPDANRLNWFVSLELRDSLNVLVSRVDTVLSGAKLSAPGFTVTVTFGADSLTVPDVGSTVEISTVKRRPANYADAFAFQTVGAHVDQAAVASELDRVKVVPNPYLVSSLYEQEYGALRREPIRALKFNNLPTKCTIYIFTIAGDKVKTIQHESDNGTEEWDMKGEGNREIAPGVYIFLVKSDTAEKVGRFAVIK